MNNLNKEDYENIANLYYESYTLNLSYTDCEKLYKKMREQYNDNLCIKYFYNEYNIKLQKNSLLIEAINEIKNKFPERNWKQENIFIKIFLDNINKQKIEKIIELRKESQEQKLKKYINIRFLNVKKKYTKKEILKSDNSSLIASELKISKEEAERIAEINYNEKMKDIKFKPYIPNK